MELPHAAGLTGEARIEPWGQRKSEAHRSRGACDAIVDVQASVGQLEASVVGDIGGRPAVARGLEGSAGLELDEAHPGTSPDPMGRPDLGLLLASDLEGGMAAGPPSEVPVRSRQILEDTGVRDDASPKERQLEGERVAVGVSRLVVRTRAADRRDHVPAVVGETNVAAPIQMVRLHGPLHRDPECGGVVDEPSRRRSDIEGRVREERDLPIRVCPHLEGTTHAPGRVFQIVYQTRRRPFGNDPREVQEIQDLFEEQAVVHRTALLVGAVGMDLVAQLRPERGRATEPSLRIAGFEKQAAEDHCGQVREEVIGLETHLGVS